MRLHLNVGSSLIVPLIYKMPSILIKPGYLLHKARELCLAMSGYSVGTHAKIVLGVLRKENLSWEW